MRPQCLLLFACFALAAQAASYNPRSDLEQGRFLKTLAQADKRLSEDENDALAWAAKSQALGSLTRLREANAAYEQALKIKPDLADALLARAMAKAGAAIQQRNLGTIKGVSNAMNDLREAAKCDPDYPLAWMMLALGYQQLPGILGGSTKKALDCAAQLKKIQPARGDMLRAQILSMSGKWADAEQYFGAALAADPRDPQIVAAYLNELGEKSAKKALGEAAQKKKLASEAKRLLPAVRTNARAVMAVSQALLIADLGEDAWKVAMESLRLIDSPSIIKYQLGKVSARAGLNLEEGLSYLDQAANEPLEGGIGGYASVHWRRGQILKALGRADEARAAANRALSFDSRHKGARELLNSL